MPDVLAEAARRGITKVVVAIDLTRGYDPGDGELRCSSVAQGGPGGNTVTSRKGRDLEEAIFEALFDAGAM